MRETWIAWLEDAVAKSKAPGATAFIGEGDTTIFHGACGLRAVLPVREAATTDTIYDLASVTKVVATTTSILLLRERGKVRLEDDVGRLLSLPALGGVHVRHLLTHTSGLPAFTALYKEVKSLDEAIARIAGMERSWPPGARRRYSDFGFMLLGKLVEVVGGSRLDQFAAENIFAPLGMKDTCFAPPPELRVRCAPTEDCPWRKRVMRGEVHDENAFAVGGVSGHAGLFSTASDLSLFCRALLGGALLRPATVDEVSALGVLPFYPWQGLGWKLDPWSGGSEGFLPARSVLGHTGWTGTCLWLDGNSRRYAILLSNTCHPTRSRRDNGTLRRRFFSRVAEAHYPRSTNTHTGLDRLLYDDFAPVAGKRLAVLTNAAAVDQLGRPLLSVLPLGPEIIIKRIFTPEHGLVGQAEAGEKVGAQEGPAPVTSLYGDRQRPLPEELAGIELFVADLPDIGTRYYTYIHTLKECMAACAAARVPMLILDRPNPLGGQVLEGPVAQRTGSAVCTAKIPIRHGMTFGETALFFQREHFRNSALQVTVNTCDAWTQDRYFPECALPWQPPSPNMPDFETALAYVGTCLFEGTNLNEGRGTETPFLILGAPWLDAEAVLHALRDAERRGFNCAPCTFTPRAIPGKASNPRHKDEGCSGIRLKIEDYRAARPFTFAVALLRAIRERHPREFAFQSNFDTLAGGPDLRQKIEGGLGVAEIVRSYEAALRLFDGVRAKRYAASRLLAL